MSRFTTFGSLTLVMAMSCTLGRSGLLDESEANDDSIGGGTAQSSGGQNLGGGIANPDGTGAAGGDTVSCSIGSCVELPANARPAVRSDTLCPDG